MTFIITQFLQFGGGSSIPFIAAQMHAEEAHLFPASRISRLIFDVLPFSMRTADGDGRTRDGVAMRSGTKSKIAKV